MTFIDIWVGWRVGASMERQKTRLLQCIRSGGETLHKPKEKLD